MTEDDARKAVFLHSFRHDLAGSPPMENGFLGMLRPYGGLREESFHEVMAALEALAPSLASGTTIDRQVMGSLWAICLFARAWGVEPEGMLRRNGLISTEDIQRLEEWIEIISWAVFLLLDGGGKEGAFEPYERYCANRRVDPL
jgi:hypothetical protein